MNQPPKCEHCNDSGWRPSRLVVKGVEYDNSVRCVCNGGKLPAADVKVRAAGGE